MPNLNDGRVYDLKHKDEIKKTFQNLYREDIDKFMDGFNVSMEHLAQEFSEGSAALENLLLSLWSHGIDTLACCRGHQDPKETHSKATENNVPYIVIIARNIPPEDLDSLIANVKENYNEDIAIKCTDNPYNREEMVISFEFRGAVKDWSKINETREAFFKMLQEKMASIKTRTINSNAIYKTKIIKSVMKDQPFSIRLQWSDKSNRLVTLMGLASDRKCPINISISIDYLKRAFPHAIEDIEKLDKGECFGVEVSLQPQEELFDDLSESIL